MAQEGARANETEKETELGSPSMQAEYFRWDTFQFVFETMGTILKIKSEFWNKPRFWTRLESHFGNRMRKILGLNYRTQL